MALLDQLNAIDLQKERKPSKVSTPEYINNQHSTPEYKPQHFQSTIRLRPGLKERIDVLKDKAQGRGVSFSFNAWVNACVEAALDEEGV